MDTPIFDAVKKEYVEALQVSYAQEQLLKYLERFPETFFELPEEYMDQIPNILSNAIRAVGAAIFDYLPEARQEVRTEGELNAFLSGALTTFSTIADLGMPERKD